MNAPVEQLDTRALFARLMAHHTAFLRYLTRRVESEAAAEDLLQEALLKSVERLREVRSPDALVGWFYRVLDNAARDHYRRVAVTSRALERMGRENGEEVVTPNEAPGKTCKCVVRLRSELKPHYALALERIEMEGVTVKDFAAHEGISRSNAAVRAFRARQALRDKVHATCGKCAAAGCTDCTCSGA